MGAICHRDNRVVHRGKKPTCHGADHRFGSQPVTPAVFSGEAGIPEERKVADFHTFTSGINTPWQHPSSKQRHAQPTQVRLPLRGYKIKATISTFH